MKRFCAKHGFYKTRRLPDAHLELESASIVAEVTMNDGLVFKNFDWWTLAYCQAHEFVLTPIIFIFKAEPAFGLKVMTGHLCRKGVKVAERRVGRAMRAMHPTFHEARITCLFLLKQFKWLLHTDNFYSYTMCLGFYTWLFLTFLFPVKGAHNLNLIPYNTEYTSCTLQSQDYAYNWSVCVEVSFFFSEGIDVINECSKIR